MVGTVTILGTLSYQIFWGLLLMIYIPANHDLCCVS